MVGVGEQDRAGLAAVADGVWQVGVVPGGALGQEVDAGAFGVEAAGGVVLQGADGQVGLEGGRGTPRWCPRSRHGDRGEVPVFRGP